ncbi:MAG: hypothetical protein GXY51_12555 [Bacteroidetes bacterium]|nr:hypothetical protein [Bacteroidota bacterium]
MNTVMGLGVSISTGGMRGLTDREHISLSYCLVSLFRWAGQAGSFPARVMAIKPFQPPSPSSTSSTPSTSSTLT